MNKIFSHQIWHLLSLIALIVAIQIHLIFSPETLNGSLYNISTYTWFWVAILIPIIHQIYVWLIWRIELYQQYFTSQMGLQLAFKTYAIGFSILFVGRLIAIIFLAFSNKNSLMIHPYIAYFIALIILPPVIYLFYSVKKYFTIKRAFGIDHFDKNYDEPFEKKGIFKYTNNGMYVYGLMILYLPGLILLSKAALIVALFNHIYIWVHYYFTERPDMIEIYGKAPDKS